MNDDQYQKIQKGRGLIAALDHSGGSTPKALSLYGIEAGDYTGEEEMFALMHVMRARIITSASFTGDRVLGVILFENTLDREIEGRGSAEYVWSVKNVVPFVKVDQGLADEIDGVQVMKPIPDLDKLLVLANEKGVFGTKMRSVIKLANQAGVDATVDQQFEIARRILDGGMVPIIELEVDINSRQKGEAESLLKSAILARLGRAEGDRSVMLKLSLPEIDDFYRDLVEHPKVLRVVCLSGGYSRAEANARLARNHGVVASFSRALAEGLSVQQSDEDFDAALDASLESIYAASLT
jgi:fructose-bisphosphate aldolase class I